MNPITCVLALALLCLPLLGARSCVNERYVLHEFSFDTCPPEGFELPQAVSFAGWEITALESQPYCHGFTKYAVTELKATRAFTDPNQIAAVYARISRRADGCRLVLVTDSACNDKESIEECDARLPRPGVHHRLAGSTETRIGKFVERIVVSQRFSLKQPAIFHSFLGRPEQLLEWCKRGAK